MITDAALDGSAVTGMYHVVDYFPKLPIFPIGEDLFRAETEIHNYRIDLEVA